MRSSIRDWWLELERLEQILNRLGPDEVCCQGLSARQCVILRMLASGEGARLSQLATVVGISPSAMTRVIEKLERLGLVLRVHGQFRDARATAVAITEAGQKMRYRIEHLMQDRTREILAGIPVPERPALLDSLRLLNHAMERPDCSALGPIWLGYYRSENGGASFQSSLVPGYPQDTSPYAALAQVRTASAGDPVIAWDAHGRVFMGSESSDDPSGSKKTFGDVWVARFDNPDGENGNTINDGKRFFGSTIVQRGTSAPNLLGRFQDKTAIEADRTGDRCDANVYFSWSSFNGAGANQIYLSRSTDHGATWAHPTKLTESLQSLQDPDISVTGNGNVYVTFRTFAFVNGEPDAIYYVKSTDCGATFSRPVLLTTFVRWDAQDQTDPQAAPATSSSFPEDVGGESIAPSKEARARDCGDFADHCLSGYTFFRVGTSPRSTADQYDAAYEYIYVVYGATKPGTQVATSTSYGTISSGTGSQSGAYFTRLDGATNTHTPPVLLDNQATGHQVWPDISADGGVLHVLWYDSRMDAAYSPARPIGNDANRLTHPSLDVYASRSNDRGGTWATSTRVTDFTSNPNYEQFDNRAVPFNGDYLWITSLGNFSFGTWTDYRNTVAGTDPREGGDSDNDGADVKQCREFNSTTGTWGPDTCPHAGGLDQNIYGAITP